MVWFLDMDAKPYVSLGMVRENMSTADTTNKLRVVGFERTDRTDTWQRYYYYY